MKEMGVLWTNLIAVAALATSIVTMVLSFNSGLERRLCRIEVNLKIGECGR